MVDSRWRLIREDRLGVTADLEHCLGMSMLKLHVGIGKEFGVGTGRIAAISISRLWRDLRLYLL